MAHLFPNQGNWSEEEYLGLNSSRLMELSDGVLQVLPMPTTSHQLIGAFIYRLLSDWVVSGKLGTVLPGFSLDVAAAFAR